MRENLILDSIRKEQLQLEVFEKCKYFKVPLLFFFGSLMSLTQGFQKFSNIDFSEITSKFSILLLIIGVTSFVLKLTRLKLISVHFDPNSIENILDLAKERNWKTELKNEKVLILKTIPIRGYNEYLSYNKHAGEKIYIFFDHRKILLRSIDNLDNHGFKSQNGENSANERAIVNRIKPAANSW